MLRTFFPTVALCVTFLGASNGTVDRIDAVLGDNKELNPKTLSVAIHEQVNDVRVETGLPALAWNGALRSVSVAHSDDMARHSYFSHTNLDGESPSDRADRLGFECRPDQKDLKFGIGENLYAGYTYGTYTLARNNRRERIKRDWKDADQIVEEVVNGWLASPGHRANLLEPNYIEEAIGVVITDDDRVYVTQNFC